MPKMISISRRNVTREPPILLYTPLERNNNNNAKKKKRKNKHKQIANVYTF